MDPLTLPQLHQMAAESADPVVALAARIESLRAEMDRAPDWKTGTTWMLDREQELANMTTRLAEMAPGHPLLPRNLAPMMPTGPAHVEPVRGKIVPLHLRDPFGYEDTPPEKLGIDQVL